MQVDDFHGRFQQLFRGHLFNEAEELCHGLVLRRQKILVFLWEELLEPLPHTDAPAGEMFREWVHEWEDLKLPLGGRRMYDKGVCPADAGAGFVNGADPVFQENAGIIFSSI